MELWEPKSMQKKKTSFHTGIKTIMFFSKEVISSDRNLGAKKEKLKQPHVEPKTAVPWEATWGWFQSESIPIEPYVKMPNLYLMVALCGL